MWIFKVLCTSSFLKDWKQIWICPQGELLVPHKVYSDSMDSDLKSPEHRTNQTEVPLANVCYTINKFMRGWQDEDKVPYIDPWWQRALKSLPVLSKTSKTKLTMVRHFSEWRETMVSDTWFFPIQSWAFQRRRHPFPFQASLQLTADARGGKDYIQSMVLVTSLL
jgi:hypothetical protein